MLLKIEQAELSNDPKLFDKKLRKIVHENIRESNTLFRNVYHNVPLNPRKHPKSEGSFREIIKDEIKIHNFSVCSSSQADKDNKTNHESSQFNGSMWKTKHFLEFVRRNEKIMWILKDLTALVNKYYIFRKKRESGFPEHITERFIHKHTFIYVVSKLQLNQKKFSLQPLPIL